MDSKDTLLGVYSQPLHAHQSPCIRNVRPGMHWLRMAAVSFVLAAWFIWTNLPAICDGISGIQLPWSERPDIPKTGRVIWHECPENSTPSLECGRVIVPLNYFNLSEGVAGIYFGRVPATKHPKQGSIMLNPGGPGGSGFDLVRGAGSALAELLGRDYDLIGFDPRGIGHTLPSVRCFTDLGQKAILESNTVLEQGFSYSRNLSDPATREELVAQERQFLTLKELEAQMCAQNMGPELAYMGTANVVRDIDFMTTVFEGENALINYWGGSYGTILGAYLVNMLPDRVRRVVIDGVANPVLWASKPSQYWHRDWVSSAEDTYQFFLSECVKAGPQACALAAHGETAADLETAIESVIDKLHESPRPVLGARRPGYLTSGVVRSAILTTLYWPRNWPVASTQLSSLLNGTDEGAAWFLNQVLPPVRDTMSAGNDMTRLAVTCADSPPPKDKSDYPTAEELADLDLAALREVSSRFALAPNIEEPDGGCQFWPVQPPERFTGPWNHTLKNPMLIVSNTMDPITPIASGRLINSLMPNSSRLLIQDSPGHCSLGLASICTVSTVQAYFANGMLPENEKHCTVDEAIFPDPNMEDLYQTLSMADRELIQNVKTVNEALTRIRMGHGI